MNLIEPNPHQPRNIFDEEALEELAQSIKSQGLLQPILVRPNNGKYQLLVGERRWRASMIAELNEIPAIVQQVDDDTSHIWALLENVQREDLNPVEEARAYQSLLRELEVSQEILAQKVGKTRSVIANAVRLLQLPSEIIENIEFGELSAGHGRLLLSLNSPKEQRKAKNIIIKKGLSVRDTELLIKSMLDRGARKIAKGEQVIDPELKRLQDLMESKLKTKISVRPSTKTRGKIEISYHTLDDFDRIVEAIGIADI